MSDRRSRAVPAPGLVRRPRPAAPAPVWDDAARRVLTHRSGRLRVLGGPGSGKTTLLLAAAAARVGADADPGRTLLLVGSRRAAVELRERLTALLQDGAAGPGTAAWTDPAEAAGAAGYDGSGVAQAGEAAGAVGHGGSGAPRAAAGHGRSGEAEARGAPGYGGSGAAEAAGAAGPGGSGAAEAAGAAGPGGSGAARGAGTGPARTLREPLVRTLHSYAFGILRLHAARQGDPPPRLLAGAEQDAVVRDLLAGELAGDVPDSGWPDRVRPALHLPAFATELRELMMRGAERSLGPDGLAELGERYGVGEWVAAGRLHQVYEHVVQLRGAAGRAAAQATAPALDAAELVTAALDALASDPELFAGESERVRHLFVDDAQDLDPQQMELVRALASTAHSVVLAGDPDQAVLGFRGADPGGLAAFEAETVVLRGSYRGARAVRAAAGTLAERLPGVGPWRPGRSTGPGAGGPDGAGDPGGPGGERPGAGAAVGAGAADRAGGVPEAGGEGVVAVRVFASAAQEANWIADRLRRAHLVDGVPWSEMAVVSRSARRALPALRRALLGAGVPIAAPPDELPLARQPAVVPLLMVLRFAARPDELDADAASALLTSVLGSADPMRLRRLRRALLRLHAAGDGAAGPERAGVSPSDLDDRPDGAGAGGAAGPPSPGEAGSRNGDGTDGTDEERAGSDPLLVDLLRDAARGRPDPLVPLPPREAAPLHRVLGLLAVAAGGVREGESAELVLWRVWEASRLATRWTEASARGGPVGAAADRDLDAVLALFDAAARYTDRLPGADVEGFISYLAGQHLPGDTALAPRAAPAEAVALLTAHAARGREWEVVAVPAVQEGSWPDLRLRGSLLGQERLVDAVAGVADPAAVVSRVAPLLAEERRLFYVACTRARRSLLVSAVQGEDEQPSRFLDELDPVPAGEAERPVHRPARSLVLAELVGELRRAVTEPDPPGCAACGPAPCAGCAARARRRERAAVQLARLAEADVPGAHPDDWYGLAPASTARPLRPPGEVVPVSPSDVEKIMRCPLRWVLERHGGGEVGALAAVTGSLVHALVQARAAGADGAELEGALRAAWSRLDAGAPWFGRRELARVRGMLSAFDEWVHTSRADGLRLVAVEHPVQLDLRPERGGPWLRLRGRVDRLEVDRDGRPVVVDVKTGRTAPTRQAVAEHAQLAVYQLAAALGAFGDVLEGAARPGGARLVYVADRLAAGAPKEPTQDPLDDEGVRHWLAVVEGCAQDTSGARFVARSGPDCDRCPVRASCPLHDAGRPVPEG